MLEVGSLRLDKLWIQMFGWPVWVAVPLTSIFHIRFNERHVNWMAHPDTTAPRLKSTKARPLVLRHVETLVFLQMRDIPRKPLSSNPIAVALGAPKSKYSASCSQVFCVQRSRLR